MPPKTYRKAAAHPSMLPKNASPLKQNRVLVANANNTTGTGTSGNSTTVVNFAASSEVPNNDTNESDQNKNDQNQGSAISIADNPVVSDINDTNINNAISTESGTIENNDVPLLPSSPGGIFNDIINAPGPQSAVIVPSPAQVIKESTVTDNSSSTAANVTIGNKKGGNASSTVSGGKGSKNNNAKGNISYLNTSSSPFPATALTNRKGAGKKATTSGSNTGVNLPQIPPKKGGLSNRNTAGAKGSGSLSTTVSTSVANVTGSTAAAAASGSAGSSDPITPAAAAPQDMSNVILDETTPYPNLQPQAPGPSVAFQLQLSQNLAQGPASSDTVGDYGDDGTNYNMENFNHENSQYYQDDTNSYQYENSQQYNGTQVKGQQQVYTDNTNVTNGNYQAQPQLQQQQSQASIVAAAQNAMRPFQSLAKPAPPSLFNVTTNGVVPTINIRSMGPSGPSGAQGQTQNQAQANQEIQNQNQGTQNGTQNENINNQQNTGPAGPGPALGSASNAPVAAGGTNNNTTNPTGPPNNNNNTNNSTTNTTNIQTNPAQPTNNLVTAIAGELEKLTLQAATSAAEAASERVEKELEFVRLENSQLKNKNENIANHLRGLMTALSGQIGQLNAVVTNDMTQLGPGPSGLMTPITSGLDGLPSMNPISITGAPIGAGGPMNVGGPNTQQQSNFKSYKERLQEMKAGAAGTGGKDLKDKDNSRDTISNTVTDNVSNLAPGPVANTRSSSTGNMMPLQSQKFGVKGKKSQTQTNTVGQQNTGGGPNRPTITPAAAAFEAQKSQTIEFNDTNLNENIVNKTLTTATVATIASEDIIDTKESQGATSLNGNTAGVPTVSKDTVGSAGGVDNLNNSNDLLNAGNGNKGEMNNTSDTESKDNNNINSKPFEPKKSEVTAPNTDQLLKEQSDRHLQEMQAVTSLVQEVKKELESLSDRLSEEIERREDAEGRNFSLETEVRILKRDVEEESRQKTVYQTQARELEQCLALAQKETERKSLEYESIIKEIRRKIDNEHDLYAKIRRIGDCIPESIIMKSYLLEEEDRSSNSNLNSNWTTHLQDMISQTDVKRDDLGMIGVLNATKFK